MAQRNDAIENDYRSSPRQPGAAHDGQSIGRMNIQNDKVSVVHSGETDPMPNREAQEAYADSVDEETRNEEEVSVADVDEVPMQAHSGNPENPTDSGATEKGDDENDFEYQQALGEEGGVVDEQKMDDEDARENVA